MEIKIQSLIQKWNENVLNILSSELKMISIQSDKLNFSFLSHFLETDVILLIEISSIQG